MNKEQKPREYTIVRHCAETNKHEVVGHLGHENNMDKCVIDKLLRIFSPELTCERAGQAWWDETKMLCKASKEGKNSYMAKLHRIRVSTLAHMMCNELVLVDENCIEGFHSIGTEGDIVSIQLGQDEFYVKAKDTE